MRVNRGINEHEGQPGINEDEGQLRINEDEWSTEDK